MNAIRIAIPLQMLRFVRVERRDHEFIATLSNERGNDRVRGYGAHPFGAMQDLNSNLI